MKKTEAGIYWNEIQWALKYKLGGVNESHLFLRDKAEKVDVLLRDQMFVYRFKDDSKIVYYAGINDFQIVAA